MNRRHYDKIGHCGSINTIKAFSCYIDLYMIHYFQSNGCDVSLFHFCRLPGDIWVKQAFSLCEMHMKARWQRCANRDSAFRCDWTEKETKVCDGSQQMDMRGIIVDIALWIFLDKMLCSYFFCKDRSSSIEIFCTCVEATRI